MLAYYFSRKIIFLHGNNLFLTQAMNQNQQPENKKSCLKLLKQDWEVVMDGIEPPTQGFSVLCSTD